MGRAGNDLPRRGVGGVLRVEAEQAGGADPHAGGIGGKIAGIESVVGKIADVVAAVEKPENRARLRVWQIRRGVGPGADLLRQHRRQRRRRQTNRGGNQECQFAHSGALNNQQGRLLRQSPFHPVSRPRRNCR